MRRRQVAITLVTAIVLGISCALYFGWRSEPSSHGYSLGHLLATYVRIYQGYLTTPGWQDTRKYVREIGTNGLPQMLRWLSEERPLWKAKAFEFHEKQLPSVLKTKVVHDWLSGEREELHAKAGVCGFEILGPTAIPALPALERIALDSKHPARSARAINALKSIGRDAVPALVRIVIAPNSTNQLQVFNALGSMGTNAAPAVPVLIELLKNKDVDVAESAIKTLDNLRLSSATVVPAIAELVEHPRLHYLVISTLADYGSNALPAIPRLVQCLTNIDQDIRVTAAFALARLKLEPEVAVPALISRLEKDNDAAVRDGASAALHAYMWPDRPKFSYQVRTRLSWGGAEVNDTERNDSLNRIELHWYARQLAAKPNGNGIEPVMSIAYLITSLTDSDPTIRQQAAEALALCGTNARPAVPALLVCLKDSHRQVVDAAIQALGDLRLEPDLVVPALIQCLKVPKSKSTAIMALAQFGKDALPAVPLLRELLDGDDDDTARLALRAIDPPPTSEPTYRAETRRGTFVTPGRIREQDYRFP
jgi:HEAT repeat protein